MYQPSIYLFSYLIHEPVTAFTDIILCCSCIMFGLNVGKSYAKKWSYFFYTIAIASFFGALGHGMYSYKNNILQLISRSSNIIAVYVATLASLKLVKNSNAKLFIKVFSLVQLIFALGYIILYNQFWVVKWDAIAGLGLFVGGVNIFLAYRGNKGSWFILVGLIINGIAAYLHSNKISISKWFNHNDISHVILILGFYFMAKGALKLHEYYAIN